MTDTITIRKPDDWHVHLREGAILESVVNYTARQFARAIVMPNLSPPITTYKAAENYRNRILRAVSSEHNFKPLMTCYLTDTIHAEEVRIGFEEKIFTACKLYPAHATTNSAYGVTDIKNIYPVLKIMQDIGMPLLLHGEVTHEHVDIFDREAVFIEEILQNVIADFPELKIVFEHITTKDAADFVMESGPNLGATITPHHLAFNRNAIFKGGIRPHYYCLPIAKREQHRLALRKAATSGSPKFFLGTDSAPHIVGAKESSCGCAGLFNAPYALESYLQTFDEEGALDKFEDFASKNGPRFYGLRLNTEKITLTRRPNKVPDNIDAGDDKILPFMSGETLNWTLEASPNPDA